MFRNTKYPALRFYAGGRSFYTGGGHTPEADAEPAFREHPPGGVGDAAGRGAAECGPRRTRDPPAPGEGPPTTRGAG